MKKLFVYKSTIRKSESDSELKVFLCARKSLIGNRENSFILMEMKISSINNYSDANILTEFAQKEGISCHEPAKHETKYLHPIE